MAVTHPLTSLLAVLAVVLQPPTPQAPPRDVAPPAQAAERFVIRGVVTDVTTGQPIRGVAISLRPARDFGAAARGTLTDDEGRWEFAGLVAGDYAINHDKAGYIRVRGVRIYSPVHVSPQFPARDLTLVLARGGIISGRVTDHIDEPAAGVQVQAHRIVSQTQVLRTRSDGTDDRGEFRLYGLEPGEYLILALPSRRFDMADDRDGKPQSPLPTYYPAALRAGEAERVTITELGDVSDLAIRLQTGRTFSITGRLTSSSRGIIRGNVNVVESGPEPGMGLMGHLYGSVGLDGRFVVPNVIPGTYRVLVHTTLDGGGEEVGEATVSVEESDVDAPIAMRGPATIRGRLVTARGAPPTARFHVNAAATRGMYFFTMPTATLTRDDGTFETTTFSSPFRLQAVPVGGGSAWRVRDVRWKGQSVREGIDAGGGDVDGLEVLVASATARLQGTVSDVRGAEGTVVIVASDEELDGGAPEWHRAVVMKGRFVSQTIPAGPYILGVVDTVSPDAITPEVAAIVKAQGQAVELGEHESKTVTLGTVINLPR